MFEPVSKRHSTPRADGCIRVGTRMELKSTGMTLVHGSFCPLLVIYDDGEIFALDNRCPHLGFALHRGSVEDGILTCPWHHARFDAATGGAFDLWADDVPTAAVELGDDGAVWVCARTRYADGDDHWRNRLRQGLQHNIGLALAKAVLGLGRETAGPSRSDPRRRCLRRAPPRRLRSGPDGSDRAWQSPASLAAKGKISRALSRSETGR